MAALEDQDWTALTQKDTRDSMETSSTVSTATNLVCCLLSIYIKTSKTKMQETTNTKSLGHLMGLYKNICDKVLISTDFRWRRHGELI